MRKLKTLNQRLSMDEGTNGRAKIQAFQNISNVRNLGSRRNSDEKKAKDARARDAIASFDPLALDSDAEKEAAHKQRRRISRKFDVLDLSGEQGYGEDQNLAGTPTKRSRK